MSLDQEGRGAFETLAVDFAGRSLRATLSAGVVSFPQHGGSHDEVIKRADDALYRAKAAGRNRVIIAA